MQKLPTTTQQWSSPKTNPLWVDMVSGQKRKKIEKQNKQTNLLTMRWSSTPFPLFPYLLWHIRNSLSTKGALLVSQQEVTTWTKLAALGQKLSCLLLGSPLETGPFGSFQCKKQIKLSTWCYQLTHLKCLYSRCSKEFLLFTLRSPSYLCPDDLGVQWMRASREGGIKCGNGPEPA